jgi:CheY-like chemotaxis protein
MLGVALLTGWGHEVMLAVNGNQALQAFQRDRFDVVLMDMQMPELSGLEATRLIREHEQRQGLARTPIIALTANAMESDRQRCLEAGMDDHLAKPLRAAELQRLLDTILEARDLKSAAALAGPDGAEPVVSGDDPALAQAVTLDYDAALAQAEPEMVAIIGATFARNCPKELLRLEDALRSDRRDEAMRTAHSLKGLFLGFGATPLSRLSQLIERWAESAPAGQAPPEVLLEALKSGSQHFLAALERAAS